MSTEELKPCPFCGGSAKSQRFGNRDGGASYAVWCNSCHISTAWMRVDDGGQRAIAAWNRRAAPAAGTVKDAARLLMAIVRSDVGTATRHKLEGGQGTQTDDGKNWLAAIEFVAAIDAHNARSPSCGS